VEEQKETTEEFSVSRDLVRFGPYGVDRRTGEVCKHNLRIRLSGQPFEVLDLLLERPGEVVTREELQQRLWRGETFVDFERSLNSAVKKLRHALNDDPQNPRYIETLPRRGYRFIGTIEPQPATTAESIAEQESSRAAALRVSHPGLPSNLTVLTDHGVVSQPTVELGSKRRIWIVAVGIAALIVVSTLVIYRANRKMQLAPVAAPSKNVNSRSSIAVLGFKNLSSGRDADWLSTAITQMLSTELANGGKVRVIPEETVARAKLDLGLKEKDGYPRDSLRALRADLGSDYVVAGSYVALGDRNSGQVRVDLRLQETISGETLASIAVSGKQSEIFDLLARAGQEMRIKLGATVPPEGDVDWRTVLPSNPEAARLYTEGLTRLRVSENLPASELLQKSLIIEPNFALGHAALAEAWSALGYDARALASAQKALSVSNGLPEDERLEIQGRYYELNHDWAGAMGVYRHLWQDFPDDLESGLKLAAAQTSAGNLNEASATLSSLRSVPASQRDDPRIDLAEASVAARNADYKRQQALAEQAAKKARSSGARLLLARAQLVKGWALDDQSQLNEALEAYSAARQIFEEAGDRDGTATALNDLGIVLQKQGNLTGARAKLEQARDYFRQVADENGYGAVLTNLGEVYRAQGELSQAEDLYREALNIFRKSGRKDNEYATMNDLGGVLYQRGDFRGARKLYENLLEVRKGAGDKNGVALAKTNLADVLRVQGELDRAVGVYEEALATFKEIGDRSATTAVGLSLARALVSKQDLPAARRSLQEALTVNLEIGAKGDAALDRVMLARVAFLERHPEQFDASVQSAIEELRAENRGADEMEARAMQAEGLLAIGKINEAKETLDKATALRVTDWLAKFRFSASSARLEAAQGNDSAAKRKLIATMADAKRAGCVVCQIEIRVALSEIDSRNGLHANKRP
jgi:DNA-binding winged helix-turn-helix (wHTH) protein/tetratricopeptide (TPR) repeat protein/TolB-like protein